MNITTLGYAVGIPFGNPIIRFYAICILLGAFLALFLSNYRVHQDGYDMHFFDTIFPIAFLSGIVGARIWYYIATYSHEFAGRPFWAFFDFRNGGLAIQGGAIAGILAGVLYAVFRRKGASLLHLADYAIPTIILAQAVGRWGNFFNQEVFGHFVSQDAWNFLPSFITNNMQNGSLPMGAYYWNGNLITAASNGIVVPEGAIATPLFLVEGIANVILYFLMAYGLPALLGKHYKNGDTAYSYFIAYGFIRAMLEPLRNPKFIMGIDGGSGLNKIDYKSFVMAICFILAGVLLIVINHIFHYFANKGKFDSYPMIKNLFIEGVDQAVVHVKKEPDSVDKTTQDKKDEEPENHDSIEIQENDFMQKLKEKEEELKDNSKKGT